GPHRTIRAARECSVRDRRHGPRGRFQVSAKPSTNDHIDQETAHRSSVSRHRSQRHVRDKVCAPGEQIREVSTAFPFGLGMKRLPTILITIALPENNIWEPKPRFRTNYSKGRIIMLENSKAFSGF